MTAQPTPPPPWQDTLAQEGSRLLDAMREVTPQVTEALIKYVWATGVTNLIVALALVIGGGALAISVMAWLMKKKDELDDSDIFGIGAVTLIGGVATIGGGVTMFTNALPKVLAPEGAAVMMALKALGGAS